MAAAFERDPRWTNATPAKLEKFKDLFGYMSVTYSNNLTTTDFHDKVESFRYKVKESGTNYVIVHFDTPINQGDMRITFVDAGAGYWIDGGLLGFGLEERFDKVQK